MAEPVRGGFDWAGLDALKEHVTLAEALEIEAVKCVAGDERHAFQEWYSTEWPKIRKRQAQAGADNATIDPAAAAEEAEQMRTAIGELEDAIAEHRRAIATNQRSPFADNDVDEMHAVLASLKDNLAAVEQFAAQEGVE